MWGVEGGTVVSDPGTQVYTWPVPGHPDRTPGPSHLSPGQTQQLPHQPFCSRSHLHKGHFPPGSESDALRTSARSRRAATGRLRAPLAARPLPTRGLRQGPPLPAGFGWKDSRKCPRTLAVCQHVLLYLVINSLPPPNGKHQRLTAL